MPIGNMFPIFSHLRTTPQIPIQIKVEKLRSLVICQIIDDAVGITLLRENGILKTDTKEKADICNRQVQSAFTCEANSNPPSNGASPFSSMGEITVDQKSNR